MDALTGTTHDVETPQGTARVDLHPADGARALLVLGHGAGGGVGAPDLVIATGVARGLGVAVALVEQPYRVAGRRSPVPAPRLDMAWTAVVDHLRAGLGSGMPLITGGRSSGARVACRAAAATGSAGVLCLAFPLQPPTRTDATRRPDRLPELAAVAVPVLIVQGERDPFGMPTETPGRRVVRLAGDHSLTSDAAGLGAAVRGWLSDLLGAPGPG